MLFLSGMGRSGRQNIDSEKKHWFTYLIKTYKGEGVPSTPIAADKTLHLEVEDKYAGFDRCFTYPTYTREGRKEHISR